MVKVGLIGVDSGNVGVVGGSGGIDSCVVIASMSVSARTG